jgi:hypothetical protein
MESINQEGSLLRPVWQEGLAGWMVIIEYYLLNPFSKCNYLNILFIKKGAFPNPPVINISARDWLEASQGLVRSWQRIG